MTVAASVAVVSRVAANTAIKHQRSTVAPVVLALAGLIVPWVAALTIGGALDSAAAAWIVGLVAVGAIYAGVASLAGGSPAFGALGGLGLAVVAGVLLVAEVVAVVTLFFSGPEAGAVFFVVVWIGAALAVFFLCITRIRWPARSAPPSSGGWPPAGAIDDVGPSS